MDIEPSGSRIHGHDADTALRVAPQSLMCSRIPVRPTSRDSTARVIRALARHAPLSRADVARITGLTRPTVTEVVRDLQRSRVVVESEFSERRGPGRPGRHLEFDAQGGRVAVIDLSDPDIVVGALSTAGGHIRGRREVVAEGEPAGRLRAVLEVARELIADAGTHLIALGVLMPTGPHNLGTLVQRLKSEITAPVDIYADADVLADMEYLLGDHEDDGLLFARVGTRVAVAIRECDDFGILLKRPKPAQLLSTTDPAPSEVGFVLHHLATALDIPRIVVSVASGQAADFFDGVKGGVRAAASGSTGPVVSLASLRDGAVRGVALRATLRQCDLLVAPIRNHSRATLT